LAAFSIRQQLFKYHKVIALSQGGTFTDYSKLVETIPAEKWAPLSEQLIGVILGAKNDQKMPNALANIILLHMKNGTASSKAGLLALLEAAVLLDAEKTVAALGELQMLKLAERLVQQMYDGGLTKNAT
jgi:predicted negative regulator of RcsB-dependent stress response